MKLKGIIEDVFRGVTIFRGYATLGTLARLSIPQNYQRPQDKYRVSKIKEYMDASSFVFFPELIFGWQIDDNQVIRQIKEDDNIGNIVLQNNIRFKKNKFKFKPFSDIEGPIAKMLTIEIPNNINAPIFSRIDGNHRLGVLDDVLQSGNESQLLNMVVPYSIIMQSQNFESDKYEAAYFYLINSKAKPLTSEENLKSILSQPTFTDSEKESLIGMDSNQIQYLVAITDYLKHYQLDFISDKFNDEIYYMTYALILQIIEKGTIYTNETFNNIIDAMKYINCMYIKKDIKYPQQNILLALIVKQHIQPESFEKFANWINKNELGAIEHISFDNIIKIYDNLHKQRAYKVFVAMPYISHARVTEYNKLFKEVLAEISKKVNYGLELIPIMRFRGSSQRIDSRLIEMIKKCDIFIGDLTTCNDNVIFEVGLAEGCGKKILLIKAEEDTDKIPFDEATKLDKGAVIPFDMDKLQYIPYSNSGYYNNIKGIMRNNIPVIVEHLRNEI
ncbi:hypothetical protein [uncultured Bacteroides sp.]|uniref:hypothetical protein n=1 Tax=uncultured Bacteroides sp. TaxID=162156 RepID=UPI00267021FE|nr:hypothetical protein [uncultured Bacteroides sp.]